MKQPFLFSREKHTPRDVLKCSIPADAIDLTERILQDYGQYQPPNEGLVYWGGHKADGIIRVRMVVAPFAESHSLRVVATNTSNAKVVSALVNKRCVYLAQVHSHPEEWVDHSDGDDEWAAFKHNGLLSIVVPHYCSNGMLPLTSCGVHRFQEGTFLRLSERYIENHFVVTRDDSVEYLDMR